MLLRIILLIFPRGFVLGTLEYDQAGRRLLSGSLSSPGVLLLSVCYQLCCSGRSSTASIHHLSGPGIFVDHGSHPQCTLSCGADREPDRLVEYPDVPSLRELSFIGHEHMFTCAEIDVPRAYALKVTVLIKAVHATRLGCICSQSLACSTGRHAPNT